MGDTQAFTTTRPDSGPLPEDVSLLLTRYEMLIHKIAHQLLARIPEIVEFEDLVSWGVAGLLEAYQRYDEERSNRFATFAYYRIRGSMLDGMNAHISDRQFQVDMACNEVLQAYAHVAVAMETYASPGDRLGHLGDALGSVAMVYILNDVPSAALRPDGAPQKQELLRQQTCQQVRDVMERLPEREKELLRQVYFNERTLTEVAENMGHSASWGSRLHTRALERLRSLIQSDPNLDDLRYGLRV